MTNIDSIYNNYVPTISAWGNKNVWTFGQRIFKNSDLHQHDLRIFSKGGTYFCLGTYGVLGAGSEDCAILVNIFIVFKTKFAVPQLMSRVFITYVDLLFLSPLFQNNKDCYGFPVLVPLILKLAYDRFIVAILNPFVLLSW